MTFPEPVPGLVIRYSYLWHNERLRKLEEGAKDRPCLIVLAVQREGKATTVTVVPITRRAPPASDLPVKLSVEAKRRLGLDDSGPSWIITSDVNEFAWPGPDIRRVATKPSIRFAYGLVPRSMFYDVRDAVVKHHEAGTLQIGRRK
jgi:PemK-like, MazF-like toxin of type II toxin-antitoxin system